jgi:hypothetical protein
MKFSMLYNRFNILQHMKHAKTGGRPYGNDSVKMSEMRRKY